MAAASVPTASHTVLRSREEALEHLASAPYPAVLKADGLAAGKGVIIAATEAEAREALDVFFVERRFGDTEVVLEEHLEGEELSVLALCDGENVVPLAPAQDYKRILDGDRGPNTGGMGSYSPVPGVDPARTEEIADAVHRPIVELLRRRGTPYHGVLYAGLMVGPAGPRVLEFNCRFGDPETQAVLPRLRSDLVELCLASRQPGGLAGAGAEFSEDWAVTVVLASAGYPASASKGDVISGLADAAAIEGVEVTHAGTAIQGSEVVTAGGRVLNVTALGHTPGEARDRAYRAAGLISFEGMQCGAISRLGRSIGSQRGSGKTAGRRGRIPPEPKGEGSMEITEPERPNGGEAEMATAEPMPEVEAAFEEIEVDAPRVGIIMGSKNDKPKMQPAGEALHEAGIRYEVRVMSAHRDPEMVREYCHAARMRGLRVIIAGAGMSAALPGVAAAHTDLPVIGVPIMEKALAGWTPCCRPCRCRPGSPSAALQSTGPRTRGCSPRA